MLPDIVLNLQELSVFKKKRVINFVSFHWKNNNIDYKIDVPEELKGQILVRCPVQMQKETANGLVDDVCDEIAPRNYAGYCK